MCRRDSCLLYAEKVYQRDIIHEHGLTYGRSDVQADDKRVGLDELVELVSRNMMALPYCRLGFTGLLGVEVWKGGALF